MIPGDVLIPDEMLIAIQDGSRTGVSSMEKDKTKWVQADFHGLFGDDLLCISHSETVTDRSGSIIQLATGMALTAFDEDADENGSSDDLFASGTVIPAPDVASCLGSKWCLKIDSNGIRHESDLHKEGNM